MNKNKWMTMAAVAALTATMAVAAPHDGGRHGKFRGARGHGELGPRLAAKLNLTDAQKEQIQALRRSFREENKAFFDSSRETFRELREARKANDTARLDALEPQVQADRRRMRELHKAQKERILNVLTAEQRAQLDALKAERKQRREKRQ